MSEEKAQAAAAEAEALKAQVKDPKALIDQNRGLKEPILAVLECMVDLSREKQEKDDGSAHADAVPETAEVSVDRSAVENAAQGLWKKSYRHTPALTVDILVRNGALDLTTLVNGEPYEGTLEDIQLDLSVPDDAEAVCDLSLTDLGREILKDYSPGVLLASLLASKAVYQEIFDAVLEACATAESGSCTRPELEEVVDGFEELTHARPDDDAQTVYPQFFLDTLEEAGGIAWDGGWKITDAGRAFLEKERSAGEAA